MSTEYTYALASEEARHAAALAAIGLGADATIDRLTAEVARLQALLDASVPPEPAEPGVGWSLGPGTPATLPRPAWVRTYLQPGEQPTDYQQDAGLKRAVEAATVGVWLSIKAKPAGWCGDLFASLPCDAVVTYRHEPQNDAGALSAADLKSYQDGWAALLAQLALFDGHARDGLRSAVIHMGSKPQSSWDAYHVDGVDLVGFDRYVNGIANAKSYTPPSVLFAPLVAYAKGKGKPLAIGETGAPLINGDTVGGRVTWAAAAADYLDDAGCALRCWWSSGPIALDPPTTQMWTR